MIQEQTQYEERRQIIVNLIERETKRLFAAMEGNGYTVERQGGSADGTRCTYRASRNDQGYSVYLYFESAVALKSRNRTGIVCRVKLSHRDRQCRYPASIEKGLNTNGIIARCNEKLDRLAAIKLESDALALQRNKRLNIVNDALAATGMDPLAGSICVNGYHTGQYSVPLHFDINETLAENLQKLVDAGLVRKAVR